MHVILADDQANVRSALRLLVEQDGASRVVAEAADAAGLLLALERHPADLVLLDWELPGLPARYLVRLIQMERPYTRILALSSRPEARQPALDAGVTAFVSKGAAPDVVRAALRGVGRAV
ncbi:MAG: response regulator transcription factor [Anaerolineales bacterium]|nr:response regulator transcription factor [Anaerolineales bacterium]